uniref:Uncharacterized protein n=1 Tax=Anguilla anguilla TaxID=7936 RepID=A0A0E9RUA8_ANGAN
MRQYVDLARSLYFLTERVPRLLKTFLFVMLTGFQLFTNYVPFC